MQSIGTGHSSLSAAKHTQGSGNSFFIAQTFLLAALESTA